jgi:hypothetical protein
MRGFGELVADIGAESALGLLVALSLRFRAFFTAIGLEID